MTRLSLFLIFFLSFAACRDNVNVSSSAVDIDATLEQLLTECVDGTYGNIPGVTLSVLSPSLPNGSWTGSVGHDSREKEDELSSDQPFRIASVTKTFVAMSILRLHEMDSLSIDDPIGKYISQEHIELLSTDGYDASKILIKHCLNHTSGLADYAQNGPDFIDNILKEPSHRWTRTEQLEGAIKWEDKLGEPGEKYSYCDTGYILLGEIIEAYFEGDLALGLRELLRYEKIGLKHTWLESMEPAPQGLLDPVHRYLGRTDATEFDASIDLYGGGGLVSTCQDLAKFMKALFKHEVFEKQETLSLMKTAPSYFPSYDPSEDRKYDDYRYGLMQFSIYGEEGYMHGGFWGTHMIYVPALDISLAANFTVGQNDRLLKKAILAIKNAQKSNQ